MKTNPGMCERCGQYATNVDSCLCRKFLVRADWLDDIDASTVYAHDAQDAAEKYSKEYDEGGDYPIINAGGDDVTVKSVGTGDEFQFYVKAWSEPTYRASLIGGSAQRFFRA